MLRDGKTSRRMLSVIGPRPHVRPGEPKYLLRLHVAVDATQLCLTSGSSMSDYQTRASSADPPLLRSISLLPSPNWVRRKRFLTEATIIIIIPWGAEAGAGVSAIPLSPKLPPIFYPFPSPIFSLPLAAARSPRGPGCLPALSLTPVFANHFFPCQQVNCFVLPFPAFITLCKLSDMSSTGARRSARRANAKIMRFGIINEDKLAVAVLLSTRTRLHYSLNLPEKMT